jgi:hypothetical protein
MDSMTGLVSIRDSFQLDEAPCTPKSGSLAQLAGVRKDQIHVIQKWAAGGRDNKEPASAGMVVLAPE